MAKRIKPIKKTVIDPEDSSYICTNDPYIIDVSAVLPRVLHRLLIYLSLTGREKAITLYLFYLERFSFLRKRNLNIPSKKIMEETGWSEPTVVKYRKSLIDIGLITQYRHTHKGMFRKSGVYLNPLSSVNINDLINKIEGEKHNSEYKKPLLGILYDTKADLSVVATSVSNRNNYKIKNDHDTKAALSVNISKDILYSSSLKRKKCASTNRDLNKSSSYSNVNEIPSKFLIQVKKLRKRIHKLFPNSYPSDNVTNQDLIRQANVLRICEKEYDWNEILKPALVYAREDSFWLKNLRSYSTLRSKWKNGETKIQNLVFQWENKKPKNITSTVHKPSNFYDTEYEITKLQELTQRIKLQNKDFPILVSQIDIIERFYNSIPERIRKASYFYYGIWDMIKDYVTWLIEDVKFKDPHFKLIDLNHDMFKEFLHKRVQDNTTCKMTVKNNKYAYRS